MKPSAGSGQSTGGCVQLKVSEVEAIAFSKNNAADFSYP
jgi:hypothetical protein